MLLLKIDKFEKDLDFFSYTDRAEKFHLVGSHQCYLLIRRYPAICRFIDSFAITVDDTQEDRVAHCPIKVLSIVTTREYACTREIVRYIEKTKFNGKREKERKKSRAKSRVNTYMRE